MIFTRKINKVPEFYTILPEKMPEFNIIIARKIFPDFFGGGVGVRVGSDPYSAWMKYVGCVHLYIPPLLPLAPFWSSPTPMNGAEIC